MNNYENDPYNDDTQKVITFTGLVVFLSIVALGVVGFVLQCIPE